MWEDPKPIMISGWDRELPEGARQAKADSELAFEQLTEDFYRYLMSNLLLGQKERKVEKRRYQGRIV